MYIFKLNLTSLQHSLIDGVEGKSSIKKIILFVAIFVADLHTPDSVPLVFTTYLNMCSVLLSIIQHLPASKYPWYLSHHPPQFPPIAGSA